MEVGTQVPQSHLGVGVLNISNSILPLSLLPALGVVQDLRRQLIDPPLKCGDRAVKSKLVEESGGVEGGGALAAIYSASAGSCEHWLDLVQRRLAWLVMFTIGETRITIFVLFLKEAGVLYCFYLVAKYQSNQLPNTSSGKMIFCEKAEKLLQSFFSQTPFIKSLCENSISS